MTEIRDTTTVVIQASVVFSVLILFGVSSCRVGEKVFPGADENTPSRAQYMTWINNTAEGSTEPQTLTNLDFFKWLHDEYGMVLDIYSFDTGNIDGVGYTYGSTDSERFKGQYPNGFEPIYEKAKTFGCRLGIWLSPDGFGDTAEQEQARTDMLVRLCRDYNFILFKFDGYAGGWLRPEKQDAFIEMLKECRKYSPDLIVLNHRLELGKALPYVTTELWEGAETYIDVWMPNKQAATHHRAGALSRALPAGLTRLTEDCGVCISSCLNFWEDDLILQAFNRSLILAPEIYGNPWFLRDDEFPKLARICNLHRRYRDILVSGIVLPEEDYGPFAVSRGDKKTRFITLRNLTWNPVKYNVKLDASIGLTDVGNIELRRFHPSERILGQYQRGAEVEVEVLPFRSCLLMATTKPTSEIGVFGCDYELVRDIPAKPVIIKLLGLPGSRKTIKLSAGGWKFTKAMLDGQKLPDILNGKWVPIEFSGTPLKRAWHRKLGELKQCDVPVDAEALYEATCFAANNNALEVRSLLRSGPSNISEVQKARKAFFKQKVFVELGVWDKNLFDGKMDTSFNICRRWTDRAWADLGPWDPTINGGSLRVDFGEAITIDKLVVGKTSEDFKPQKAEVSADLEKWIPISLSRENQNDVIVKNFPADEPVRYLRIDDSPDRVAEVEGYRGGVKLDRSKWRASNLFGPYTKAPAVTAWSLSFVLDEAPAGGYLAIPVIGQHGKERAYAALRIDGEFVGAPDRSLSYPSNVWEYCNAESDSDYTYYVPVTQKMLNKKIDVVVLILKGGSNNVKPEVWITAYPIPFQRKELILTATDTVQ
ncbi:MAG: hypothetical protein JSV82_06620 [Planctomycetota bacterium]|nr:MAG: hypothetical protein JSV82_06620 [Planctomycetota bacterium]